MRERVNHCLLGQHHMLDRVAYDYVTEIKTHGANVAKIKYELAERAKKYSEKDKATLRELIQKWLTK